VSTVCFNLIFSGIIFHILGHIDPSIMGPEAEVVGAADSQHANGGDGAVMVRISFEAYWRSHCDALGNLTVLFFYLGTSAMLVATMTFMFTLFTVTYENNMGAYVGISTIGLSLIVCLCLAVYLRLYDQKISQLRVSVDQEVVEDKRTVMTRLYSLMNRNSSNNSNGTDQTPATTNSREQPVPRNAESRSAGGRQEREASSSRRPNFYSSHDHRHHLQQRDGPIHSLSDGDEPPSARLEYRPDGLPYPSRTSRSVWGNKKGGSKKGKKTK
jgi:hypothetical protein